MKWSCFRLREEHLLENWPQRLHFSFPFMRLGFSCAEVMNTTMKVVSQNKCMVGRVTLRPAQQSIYKSRYYRDLYMHVFKTTSPRLLDMMLGESIHLLSSSVQARPRLALLVPIPLEASFCFSLPLASPLLHKRHLHTKMLSWPIAELRR